MMASYSASLNKDDILTSVERSLGMTEAVMVLSEVSQLRSAKFGLVSPCLWGRCVIDQKGVSGESDIYSHVCCLPLKFISLFISPPLLILSSEEIGASLM